MSRGLGASQDTDQRRRSRELATSSYAEPGSSDVIGSSVHIRGRVTGDGDLRLEGTVEGDIKLSGALELSPGATVNGNVQATSVTIEGALTGDVFADGAIAVRAGATLVGNLTAAEVTLDEGASFNGRIEAEFDLPAELEPHQGR